MTKKKKLLIALLSATCLTAGACGFAACKKNDDKKDTPPSPPSVNYAYTVVAKDGDDNPVKDVYFQIGYYDQQQLVFVPVTHTVEGSEVTLIAKTGDDGKAGFDFEPETGKVYQVKLADPNDVGEGVRAYPYGYRAEAESVNYLNNATTVEYPFEYVPNGFFENERKMLNYKRVYDEQTQAPKEVKSENKFSLKKDIHSYFYFQPYEAPEGGGAEGDEKRALFTQTAAGVYEISFSTASSANVTMYSFSGTDAFCYVDQTTGKPHSSTVLDTVTSSESKITVELTVYGERARASQYFAIYADADCDVTVNVTRTGDANEPVTVPKTDATFTAPTSNFANNPDGKLTLMPLDGTLSVVKGGDGYYHVGSESGPLLLANLTKTVKRVGEYPINTLPLHDVAAGDTFVVGKYEDDILVERLDYNGLLSAYAGKVNSDGVYPVNDDLYKFLNEFRLKWATASLSQYDWLIPCQYYAPDDGFEAKGAGTESDPFVLLESLNKLTNTGNSAWVSFTATATGVYSFDPASGEFTAPQTAVSTLNGDGLLCIALNAGDTVKMQLGVASANTSVNVTSEAKGVLEAATKEVSGTDNEGNPTTSIEPGAGTSASEAIPFTATGVYAFIIDDDETMSKNGLYVKIPALISGTYTLKVYGNGTGIVKGDAAAVTTLTLDVTGGQQYGLVLKADAAGVYLLDVAFDGATDPYALKVGTNSISIRGDQSFDGVGYTFTSDEGGIFTLTTDSDISIIYVNDYSNVIMEPEYVFQLAAGDTVTFICSMNDDKDTTYNLIITEGGELPEVTTLKLGEPVDITVPSGNDGYSSPLTATAGTYTLAIQGGPAIGQTAFTVYVDTGMGPAGMQSYSVSASNDFVTDITLPDGEVTIAIVSSNNGAVDITVTITKK